MKWQQSIGSRVLLSLGLIPASLILSVLFLVYSGLLNSIVLGPVFLALSAFHIVHRSLHSYLRFCATLVWFQISYGILVRFVFEIVLGVPETDRSNSLAAVAELRTGQLSLYMVCQLMQMVYLAPFVLVLNADVISPEGPLSLVDATLITLDMIADAMTIGALDIFHLHFSKIEILSRGLLPELFRYTMNLDYSIAVIVALFGLASYYVLGPRTIETAERIE